MSSTSSMSETTPWVQTIFAGSPLMQILKARPSDLSTGDVKKRQESPEPKETTGSVSESTESTDGTLNTNETVYRRPSPFPL